MKHKVVAIVGAGAVGSTTAYALMMRGIASHIMLVDRNAEKCEGEIKDLTDALSMSGASTISSGTLADAGQADIIIISAGVPQKPGQTRLELLQTNQAVMASIVAGMQPIKKSAIIIVVTNPVDILTRYVQALAGLPHNQVFGSGTFLDSQRLRGFIGERLSIDQRSIHAYVLGEHGDSQFVAWSTADIGGVPLTQFAGLSQPELDAMAVRAQRKAYEIISCKGFTSFSIAACVATYCQNILADSKRVVPVSCFLEKEGVYLSMPAVLGKNGVEKILHPPFTEQEQQKLAACVAVVKKGYEEIK